MHVLVRFQLVTVVTALAIMSGCVHSRSAAARPAVRGTGPITESELVRLQGWDTYEAIKLLRPQFLQDRGQTSIVLDSPRQPEVAIDGVMYGRVKSLQQLPASEVSRISLLNVGDALIKYGPGHVAGVIDIVTKH